MVINKNMHHLLEKMRRADDTVQPALTLSSNEMGIRLIESYYQTKNRKLRKLIESFMQEAGVVWERKLLLKDIGPVASSQRSLASLAEYTKLLHGKNDEYPEVSMG